MQDRARSLPGGGCARRDDSMARIFRPRTKATHRRDEGPMAARSVPGFRRQKGRPGRVVLFSIGRMIQHLNSSRNKPARVIVLGGSGFVGKALVTHLEVHDECFAYET